MKVTQYRGSLTPKQASVGMSHATENAKALLEDSLLLFTNDRYERAVSLAILAIEEIGKLPIIRGIMMEDDSKLLEKQWKSYRRHSDKNVSWILPELVAKGARQLEELKPLFDKTLNHGLELDNIKQLSFYSDALSDCKWILPSKVVTKEIAKEIIERAELLVVKSRNDMASEAALCIYFKHLKPVWNLEMYKMKAALINCYREAEDNGLIPEGSTTAMIEFVAE